MQMAGMHDCTGDSTAFYKSSAPFWMPIAMSRASFCIAVADEPQATSLLLFSGVFSCLRCELELNCAAVTMAAGCLKADATT
jgi:hypothetical protein